MSSQVVNPITLIFFFPPTQLFLQERHDAHCKIGYFAFDATVFFECLIFFNCVEYVKEAGAHYCSNDLSDQESVFPLRRMASSWLL